MIHDAAYARELRIVGALALNILVLVGIVLLHPKIAGIDARHLATGILFFFLGPIIFIFQVWYAMIVPLLLIGVALAAYYILDGWKQFAAFTGICAIWLTFGFYAVSGE